MTQGQKALAATMVLGGAEIFRSGREAARILGIDEAQIRNARMILEYAPELA